MPISDSRTIRTRALTKLRRNLAVGRGRILLVVQALHQSRYGSALPSQDWSEYHFDPWWAATETPAGKRRLLVGVSLAAGLLAGALVILIPRLDQVNIRRPSTEPLLTREMGDSVFRGADKGFREYVADKGRHSLLPHYTSLIVEDVCKFRHLYSDEEMAAILTDLAAIIKPACGPCSEQLLAER